MDNPEINTVDVVISGEIITLTSTESVEYIQRVARYIDKKIGLLQNRKKVLGVDSFTKTLHIALNIADDLFHEIEKNEKLEKTLDECQRQLHTYGAELHKLQEENHLLETLLKETQMERTAVRAELNEYIETFSEKPPESQPPGHAQGGNRE